MYNYDFKNNNESMIKEASNINIKIDDNYYQVNFVLTEKNLLAFYDIYKGEPIWSVGAHYIKELCVLFSIPINKVKYIVEQDNLYLIVNNKKINCYDFDLKSFKKIKDN